MLTKFEENKARALVYQDGVAPQIAVKMRFITQKSPLISRTYLCGGCPNCTIFELQTLRILRAHRAEVLAIRQQLSYVREKLAA